MSGWNNSVSRGLRIAEGALWAGAGLIVLTAHVGAAAWLQREPPLVASDNLPPAAIMIEFAETPEAMMTEENEISPDQQTSDSVQPTEKVEAQETPSEQTPSEEIAETEPEPVEPEPVEEVIEAEPDTVDTEILAQLDKVEVPLPEAKPKPLEKKQPEKKREEAKKPERKKPVRQTQQDQSASKQAVEAQVQTTQSNRNAGRQTASGLFSSQTPAKWQSRLMAHLERRKKYPAGARSRGERGVVYVRFSIDDGGNVLSAALARSSGYPELDSEVLSLIRRASPVPAPPPNAKRTITAPVKFDVR